MKYEINYTKIDNEGEKRAKAVKDIKNYLGTKTFNKIKKILLDCYAGRPTEKQLAIDLWFVGIEGYPVQALAETLWPAAPKLEIVK
jgi:hypothetical protein